jgi:integrase
MLIDLLRQITSPSMTVQGLATEWLDDAQHRLRPDWFKEAKRLLTKEILPTIGSRRAKSVARLDLVRVIEGLRHRPSVARNTHIVLSAMWGWGLQTGRVQSNPMVSLRRVRANARDRVLDEGELQAIWAATADGSAHSRIVRLLMLTGCRRDEIGHLRWSEVRADRIELPGDRTKNHRPHQVPLCALALAQLPKRRTTWPFVFGRRKASGFTGWSRCKARLDERSGVTAWTLHDLRRSFVTHAAERRLAHTDVIEAFINHASGVRGGVAGVYNRSHLWNERVALAKAWATSFDPPGVSPPVPSDHPAQ